MNKTPTPETDAMEFFDSLCDPDRVVEADFARKLERERDSLIDQRNFAQNLIRILERERDEARELADRLAKASSRE